MCEWTRPCTLLFEGLGTVDKLSPCLRSACANSFGDHRNQCRSRQEILTCNIHYPNSRCSLKFGRCISLLPRVHVVIPSDRRQHATEPDDGHTKNFLHSFVCPPSALTTGSFVLYAWSLTSGVALHFRSIAEHVAPGSIAQHDAWMRANINIHSKDLPLMNPFDVFMFAMLYLLVLLVLRTAMRYPTFSHVEKFAYHVTSLCCYPIPLGACNIFWLRSCIYVRYLFHAS